MTWRQVEELCGALGVAEEQALEAWQRAGGVDDGLVSWEIILSHLAAVFTRVSSQQLIKCLSYYSTQPVQQQPLYM